MSQQEPIDAAIKEDILEWQIYNNVRDIVHAEVLAIKGKKTRDEDDVVKLEKLTRIYANLKDDLREDLKSGLWKAANIS